MLGVALAFSVHLINASALGEFASAVRAINGQPDLELRATSGGFDEALYERVATHPQVALASPVLDVVVLVPGADGARRPLRLLGVDALRVATIAPALLPLLRPGADRFALFEPDAVFLNAAAANAFPGGTLQVQTALSLRTLRVQGSLNAPGAPLAVMDIGAAQDLLGRGGELSRIDVRLTPGADRAGLLRELALPPGVQVAAPGDAAQRVSNLSRAYRVNLTVLALVAMFTGAFLVFSVLTLGVAQRAAQFALLGVLGLTARQRMQLVLAEALALGLAGSALGLAAGTGLAALALRWLGGDLGGGYFPGVAPTLQWDAPAAALYGALGLASALAGAWWPARQMQQLPLAQTLKGLGAATAGRHAGLAGLGLIVVAGLLALAPPVAGLPLAAYLSVALLLVGGIAILPGLVARLLATLAPGLARHALPMLVLERARRVPHAASVAVGGVVAALALSVALTVMVASFRDSVTQWLDNVLPAPLYLRTATASGTAETAWFEPGFVRAVAALSGVQRVSAVRLRPLQLDPARPAVVLIARELDDPARALPLVGEQRPVPAGHTGVYASEAMADLYGLSPGSVVHLPGLRPEFMENRPSARTGSGGPTIFFIAGLWRDYARQSGALVMDLSTYQRLTGDTRVNDIALWLQPGADTAAVQASVRTLAARTGAQDLLEFASAGQIRATSLRIFDRSFAVTYWLQAVAIAIGLFGVAASFAAQVLARRHEFGLLAHLGLTRRQILWIVAGEGAAWTLLGAMAGLGLGLAVSAVLVHVVNPQSFHWTMELSLPAARLAALCTAVVLAGTLTAWLSGRAAAGRDAVLAVRQDW